MVKEKAAETEQKLADNLFTTEGRKEMSLAAKIAAIVGDVGDIPKNGKNAHFNYAFMTESDVVGALRPLLAKYSVTILSDIAKVETIAQDYTRLTVTYTLINGDAKEDIYVLQIVGDAQDRQDKGINKASTAAHKLFLKRIFHLGSEDDTEADHAGTGTGDAADPRQPGAGAHAPRPSRGVSTDANGPATHYNFPYEIKDKFTPALKDAGFRWTAASKSWGGDASKLHPDMQAALEEFRISGPQSNTVEAKKPLVSAPAEAAEVAPPRTMAEVFGDDQEIPF